MFALNLIGEGKTCACFTTTTALSLALVDVPDTHHFSTHGMTTTFADGGS